MKFSCEQCKTKYSIADERVRGKVLKIRCKHCSFIMTVREQEPSKGREKGALERAMDRALLAPPASAFHQSESTLIGTPESLFPGSSVTPSNGALLEWHISVDGVAHGPLELRALAQRIVSERAAGDREVFVWRDGFDDWLLPEEVADVWAAMEKLRPGLPRSLAVVLSAPLSALAPMAPLDKPKTTEPVDAVESFEFADEPVTTARPRPAGLVSGPKGGLLGFKAAPIGAKTTLPSLKVAPPGLRPPPLPFEMDELSPVRSAPVKLAPTVSAARESRTAAAGPPPDVSSSSQSINVALASLEDLEPPDFAAAAKKDADRVKGAGAPWAASVEAVKNGNASAAPHGVGAGLGDDGHLLISEPSQLIDLSSLIGAVPASSPAGGGDMALPGVPETPRFLPSSSVLVVAGPAPVDSTRQLKLVLIGAMGMVVLLLGTVAYLLLHRTGGGNDTAVERRPESKAVNDHPVGVLDDPAQTTVPASDGGVKKAPVVRKAVKLPAAANGKGQLNGNAATLAKLYEESGGTAPNLPASAQGVGSLGGGASEAELQDVMRKNQKSLSVCYDRTLKHDDSLRHARIDVHVRVGISGTVTHVSIGGPYASSELGTCMQQTIRRWHFPPSDSDYETQFPLILTAN